MTSSTLSRSVKATPKMADEPDTNGIPLTDPSLEPTSEEWTTWEVMTGRGKKILRVAGGKGRISFNGAARSGGEARFYRNETTKVYDAVITGVEYIISDRCALIDMPTTSGKAVGTIPSPYMSTGTVDVEELPPWETK